MDGGDIFFHVFDQKVYTSENCELRASHSQPFNGIEFEC